MKTSPSEPGGRLRVPCPAKVNLLLSVHGRRPDGFHELTSLAAPLEFGDVLEVERAEGADALICDAADVPTDGDNLVLRAARVFREAAGLDAFFRFVLEKRVPAGAGLGGGSSDAASALSAMNRLCGEPLGPERLRAAAAAVGSDCPLFLGGGPVVLRGRGERLQVLDGEVRERLRGRPLVLFKPPLAVSTAWAYGALAAAGKGACEPADEADRRLGRFLAGAPLEELLANTLEPVVGAKFLALPALLGRLRAEFGLPCLMSGSGSCCFGLPDAGNAATGTLEDLVRECWGGGAFWVETRIA
jgi:4-diphosphocytidyl-2-C-methyl-D-erythritol kinase